MIKKILIMFILIFILTLSSCNKYESQIKSFTYFGTTIEIEVYAKEKIANEYLDYANNLLKEYSYLTDRYYSYSNYTNIKTINDSKEELVINEKLYNLISYSINSSLEYFDISIGTIIDVYKNYYINNVVVNIPKDSELESLNYGIENIVLDETKHSIKLLNGVKLDLGGVAKGYAVNELVKYYDNLGVKYIINAGESTIITSFGNPRRDNNSYLVGLINPDKILDSSLNDIYAVIDLPHNKALTTSGDYQKFFIYNEKIYSSIMDKSTKKPIDTDIRSITILTDNALIGDMLSTELFMKGSIDAYNYLIENNIDGITYTNTSEIIATENIKNYIKLQSGYKYKE